MAAAEPVSPIADADLALLCEAASGAGRIALDWFRADNKVWMKQGNSPVSEADYAVDLFLRERLRAARPLFGWLSEETADTPERLGCDLVFVVDPIDGTRGFLKGDPNWCISLAIVDAAGPVRAVLHAPAAGRTFAAARGEGAWLNGDRLRIAGTPPIRRLSGSHRINESLRRSFPGRYQLVPLLPSLACRLSLVATGEVDGAFASPGAREWDVAAADLILRECGALLTTLEGDSLSYNQAAARLPALAAAPAGGHAQVLDIAKAAGFLH